MPAIARSGRARISIRHPQALGECDRCGLWRNLVALKQQFQWGGYSLINTGLLVCSDCLDVPQEQLRTPILRPDPVPLVPSRPSFNVTPIPSLGQPLPTSPMNQGFTPIMVGAPGLGSAYPANTQANVLANISAQAGITTPASVASMSFPLAAGTSAPIVLADATRSFLAVYNPTFAPVQLALSSLAIGGAITNLTIGPNEAYLSATAQGLGTAYQSVLSALSQSGGNLPVWVFSDGVVFAGDGGVLTFPSNAVAIASGFPTADPGWPVGRFYSNGLAICMSHPESVVPVPSAPLYYPSIYPATLAALNGAVLPTTMPTAGSGQLWSNGGLVCYA